MGIILVRAVRKAMDQEKKMLGFLNEMLENPTNAFLQRQMCHKLLIRVHHRVPAGLRRKHCDIFLDNEGIERIFDILQRHTHELALRAAFELVCELAHDDIVAERLHELDILARMEKVAEEYPDDQYLVSDCKVAKLTLQATFVRIVSRRVQRAVVDRDINKIIMLMSLHPTSYPLQLTAVDALLVITGPLAGREEFCREVVELDRQGHGVSSTLIASMQAHLDEVELIEKFVTLVNVMTRNFQMCAILGKHDMVAMLLDLFEHHRSERFMLQFAIFPLNEMLRVEKNAIRFHNLEGPKRIYAVLKWLEKEARVSGAGDRVTGKDLADWKAQRNGGSTVAAAAAAAAAASGQEWSAGQVAEMPGGEKNGDVLSRAAAVYSVDDSAEAAITTEWEAEIKLRMPALKPIRDTEILAVPALVLPLITRRMLAAYAKAERDLRIGEQEEQEEQHDKGEGGTEGEGEGEGEAEMTKDERGATLAVDVHDVNTNTRESNRSFGRGQSSAKVAAEAS
jgi:hypothetical protein